MLSDALAKERGEGGLEVEIVRGGSEEAVNEEKEAICCVIVTGAVYVGPVHEDRADPFQRVREFVAAVVFVK